MRYAADDVIVGITLVNVRALLERDELGITIPQAIDVRSDEIALVVAG